MGDLDMGEQFLNFPMHPKLQQFCGIDLHPLLAPNSKKTMWFRWTRCMMGLRPSPYYAIQGTYLAEELVQGDHHDASNPLHWEDVQLNLSGSDTYQPQLPWVYRTTREGLPAGVIKCYVDDIRSVGHSEAHCWRIGHRVATYYSYLGL
jgi:hypothetical protein